MKKFCIVFGFLFIIILTVVLTAQPSAEKTEFLRLHVRANSDSVIDQEIKYEVKDAIVEYLMPVAASCESKEDAMAKLEDSLSGIEAVADRVLSEHGFSYRAKADLRREDFPTRVYEDVTLEAGVYDALIVELGSGEGANWWCVLYPPMCFAGEADGNNIRYRSRIYEIIRDFFAN